MLGQLMPTQAMVDTSVHSSRPGLKKPSSLFRPVSSSVSSSSALPKISSMSHQRLGACLLSVSCASVAKHDCVYRSWLSHFCQLYATGVSHSSQPAMEEVAAFAAAAQYALVKLGLI